MTTWEQDEQARQFARHREAFAKKRKRDQDKVRAKEQFGPGGIGIPPTDEDPSPQRMAV